MIKTLAEEYESWPFKYFAGHLLTIMFTGHFVLSLFCWLAHTVGQLYFLNQLGNAAYWLLTFPIIAVGFGLHIHTLYDKKQWKRASSRLLYGLAVTVLVCVVELTFTRPQTEIHIMGDNGCRWIIHYNTWWWFE